MKTLKSITEVFYKGHKFYICEDAEKRVWGISEEYITDGRLNREINGISGLMSNTFGECMEQIKMHVEVDELINSGMTVDEAIISYFHVSSVSELTSLLS